MKPQNITQTIRKLMHYMGNHALLFVLVGILVALSALGNLLGTYMIRPVVNEVLNTGLDKAFLQILLMAFIFLIGVLSALGYTQIMAVAAQKVVKDIRQDLFHVLQKLPLSFFDTHSHGELMSRFTNDVDTVSDALNNSFAMMIQSFIQVVGTLILLFVLSWRLSLIVVLFYIIMFIYIQFSSKKSKSYFSLQQKNIGDINGFTEEMISGQKVVKVFNHEKANQKVFEKLNKNLQRSSAKAQGYAQTIVPMVVSLSYVNYAIVSVLGGYMVLRGQMDVGSLASYLIFVRQAAMPINQFTMQMNLLLTSLSGAERIFELMNMDPEVDQGKITLVSIRKENDQIIETKENTGKWAWRHPRENGIEYVLLQGDVRFHDVSFGYTRKKTILHDISLYAKPGQKVAFVGATGAGKTTITNLINRFYDIQNGSITYDGIDIKLIKKADLRRSLGIVLQDTHLFTGTILDNIRFGNLEAIDDECVRAAKLANADSFIRRLPQGYQTMIHNDGSNLSTGQRQLLAIARAAVADPPVLILDEATSSIDTRTEQLIEKGMDQLMEGRTVFVIAHRLSTVRNADVIIVLDHGQIIERGNHEQLIDQHGVYYQLYTGMFELS
ncbi:ABC transporter ATP-binding protein [Faecalicoccus pleomorphus]|uniref:ABC transporter ATP-binding protein n=1 Tax=Faecalicoccus pleomorphus TaxID=1323 RepID=A0AAW6CS40_9FIRM|nr:ABC transporter ATP-binding protein [Faecalicoccus pleomorphus]MDB7979868.1 ABC transporter ATP-binding protein [Faecalicoccus pleomorphus]MDB7982131.1 ABC transporter ATP-binding protein [Faecalicoccus pleomorphus]